MKAFILILCLGAAIAGGYWLTQKSDSGQSPRGGPPAGFGARTIMVSAESVQTMAISDVIEAVGTAQANESVTIAAKVTDTVRTVDFDDGQYVERGDVLVQLTNSEESALLAEARANLDDARRQLLRARDLGDQGLISKSSVDETLAREEALSARLDTIVARLDDRLIRAPFSGVLGFRQVSPGTLLTPTTAVATLDDISTIKVDFTVPEVSLSQVAVGDEIDAHSVSWPSRTFSGRVTTIGSRVNPVTRAVSVRAAVANDDRALRPGMLLTVRMKTAERVAVTIPERALDNVRNQSFAFVLEDGKANRREIQVGARRDGRVEVLQGLADGELVVTEGLVKIRDGSAVQVAGSPAAAPPVASKVESAATRSEG